jgi:hypothetical protein
MTDVTRKRYERRVGLSDQEHESARKIAEEADAAELAAIEADIAWDISSLHEEIGRLNAEYTAGRIMGKVISSFRLVPRSRA